MFATTEDSPTLRSMSIRAFIHHLEEVHASPTSPSLAKKPSSSPPSSSSSSRVHAENMKETSDEAVLPSLTDIQPRPLSSLTILSRSTLTTELDHHQVLERIEKLIRAKALDYTVNLETASVECQTPCNLSFALYFWTNDQGKMLVEIQRRNGCAILMHRVHKTFFRALLCRDESPEPSTTRQETSSSWLQRCPLHMTVSPRVKQMMEKDLVQEEKEQPQETKVLRESLDICEEQLCSERRDLHQLAMESLVHLTEPQNSSPCIARSVAQALLSEGDSQDNHLHYEFVDTLRSSTRHRRRESFKYEYSGEAPIQEGQYDKTMAILSLTTLYNAIKVARNCEYCSKLDMSSHSWRRIATSLKESLADPVRHMQDATMAARCIRLMEDLDHRTTAYFLEDEALVEHLMGETAAI